MKYLLSTNLPLLWSKSFYGIQKINNCCAIENGILQGVAIDVIVKYPFSYVDSKKYIEKFLVKNVINPLVNSISRWSKKTI